MSKRKQTFDPSIYDVDYEPIPSDYMVLNPNSTDVFHFAPDDPRWPKNAPKKTRKVKGEAQ